MSFPFLYYSWQEKEGSWYIQYPRLFCGIPSKTMHKSTPPSSSQTIWPRWASRQFLTLSIVQTLLPVTFGYSLTSEAVILRQLRRWKRLWRRSLTCSHKRTSMGPSRSCWNGTTSALQPKELTSKSSMCVLSIKVPIRKKSGNLFNDPHTYQVTETHRKVSG